MVHFAAYKAVGESLDKPLDYYENNIGGSISLLKAMRECDCRVCTALCCATTLQQCVQASMGPAPQLHVSFKSSW